MLDDAARIAGGRLEAGLLPRWISFVGWDERPPVFREIEPDLFTSTGLTSEDDRDRSPLTRTLTGSTGLPVAMDRVEMDCD